MAHCTLVDILRLRDSLQSDGTLAGKLDGRGSAINNEVLAVNGRFLARGLVTASPSVHVGAWLSHVDLVHPAALGKA